MITQGLLSQKTDSDLILRLYTGNNLLRIVFLKDHLVKCVNRKICQLYLNDTVKKITWAAMYRMDWNGKTYPKPWESNCSGLMMTVSWTREDGDKQIN